ncbi:MAG: class II aldolase/adducin family protein [Rhodospirillaceae bacterium]|nr:MAG: class II aldolase/adducin family protein [Rhodospirillaceae bacterium]
MQSRYRFDQCDCPSKGVLVSEPENILREKLSIAWRFFYGRGFVDGFGHISARTEDPNVVLMTPHDLGKLSHPEDFLLCDLDGNLIGKEGKLPGELPIHLEVFKARPDVNSVAHFHTHNATSFSMSEHDLKPTYFMASIFNGGIPVHPDSRLIMTEERGRAMAETLGDSRAMLLRAHGIVVTGPDIEEMTTGVYFMEDNARRTAIAASMGDYETLGEEEMAEISAELLKTRGPIGRVWALAEIEAQEVC